MASRNKLAFWVNDRKNAANQPDYKGKFELSWELLQEANAAFASGQYENDYNGQPCIKLDVALYAQQVSPGDRKPIMSGGVSTLAETQQGAALRQQAAQGYAQAHQQHAPQGHAQPQQPQYAQPPAAPQAWPAHAPMPAGFIDQAQQPAYPQPQPAQGYAQQPAQPQAPMPVAPPAPVQPMSGAIHGQPPAGFAGSTLAPGQIAAAGLPQNF